MSLDLNNVPTKFQLDWPAKQQNYCRVFVFSVSQLFKMLGNTGMVAKGKAAKFLYLEDEP